MTKYKWDTPGDWLHEKIQGAGEDVLRGYLMAIIGSLDSDTIQDLFENDMAADGYFENLGKTWLLLREGDLYLVQEGDGSDGADEYEHLYAAIQAVPDGTTGWREPTEDEKREYGDVVVLVADPL